MKKVALLSTLALIATPFMSLAAVQISDGNVLQPSCRLGFSEDIRSFGTLTPGRGNLVKNKKVSTGKVISAGDVVYYAQLEKSTTFFSSTKDAEVKDKSPFTPDKKLDANHRYPVWANFTTRSGKRYWILDQTGGYLMPIINEDGFLCSDVIIEDRGVVKSVGMPQAYQEIPFERIEEPLGDGSTTAIAITLKEFDAVSFTFDVAVLNNGRVSSRKQVGFDLLSGQADIGGLNVEVEAAEKIGIKVKSITEPLDYAVWLKNVFNKSF